MYAGIRWRIGLACVVAALLFALYQMCQSRRRIPARGTDTRRRIPARGIPTILRAARCARRRGVALDSYLKLIAKGINLSKNKTSLSLLRLLVSVYNNLL